jgi:hypothetical protein
MFYSRNFAYVLFNDATTALTARSKTWICSLFLAEYVGSNPAISVGSVVCCQVEVYATS